MLKSVWVWFLTHIYKLLIVRVQTLDKEKIRGYDKLQTLGVVEIASSLGPFTFIFKNDRRLHNREKHTGFLTISSYFVELKCPEGIALEDNDFHQKAILIVKLKVKKTNYDALGKILLNTYLDSFLNKAV